jgi:hypothetical protein
MIYLDDILLDGRRLRGDIPVNLGNLDIKVEKVVLGVQLQRKRTRDGKCFQIKDL